MNDHPSKTLSAPRRLIHRTGRQPGDQVPLQPDDWRQHRKQLDGSRSEYDAPL